MYNARNFLFRQNINPENRKGRFVTGDEAILFGSPVTVDVTAGDDSDGSDGYGRSIVRLADSSDLPSANAGILAYDGFVNDGMRGEDPVLTRVADLGLVDANTAVQVVSGTATRFTLINTEERSVGGGLRTYPARVMVADLAAATPTIAIGSYIKPIDAGDDTVGYWEPTATKAEAWAEVTAVDLDLQSLDAQLLF